MEKTMSFYADDIISEDPACQYRYTGRGEVMNMFMDVYARPDVCVEYTSSFVSSNGRRAAAEFTWSGTKNGRDCSIPGVPILESGGVIDLEA